MADIAETAAFTDPTIAISQGKRHLLVRDYSMAVSALAQACQLLAEKHGDTADELGEPYLLYGRALLSLAREEAGVLGGGVPGTEDAENAGEDDDDDEDDEEEADEDEDEEEEESGNPEDPEKGGKADVEKKEGKETTDAENEDAGGGGTSGKGGTTVKEDKADSTEKKGEEETGKEKKSEDEEPQKSAESSKSDATAAAKSSKEANDNAEQSSTTKQPASSSSSSSSSSTSAEGKPGPSSAITQNGDARKSGEEEGEAVGKDGDDEEDVNNLQVAWEVLELAKLVLSRRGQSKLLADAYRLLGEVAMEGGNHQGALNDLQSCLQLLRDIEPRDARAIAEIHYQLALAHSLGNDFDASIEEFTMATELLEARIRELSEMKEPPKTDDSFYTVEGEIKELKELLPEIREKISDMKDFKQEACRLVIEGIKSKVAEGSCSNGAGPSDGEGSSSSAAKTPKPATDISHLVRKKRKADEPEEAATASPCKKPTPEKAV